MRLTVGQWCVILAPDDEDEEFWLGRTVAIDEWGGACRRQHKQMKQADESKGTPRFDKGDVEIAVQWYGRVAGSVSPRKYKIEANEVIRSVSRTILLASGEGTATLLAGHVFAVGVAALLPQSSRRPEMRRSVPGACQPQRRD